MLRSLYPTQPPKDQPHLVLVCYPGVVKNIDKALATLGGISGIQQAYFGNRALELRHTPANPYTSCLRSERKLESKITSGTVHMAIKVRRKKRNPKIVEAECLGMLTAQYRFDTMCDFQYLPIRGRSDAPGVFDDLIPKLIPLNLPAALGWMDRPDADASDTPLFLPPYQFSRYTTPSTKILCRETVFGEKTRKKALGHGHNLRMERRALSLTLHSNDEFPLAPSEEAVSDANFRCKNEEPHRLVRELFEERPLWTRVAVSYRTGLDETILRTLLQKFAFYILNGPWGRSWCRFGYDPRKDPQAVDYQTLMVSFRQHTKIPERQRLKVSSTERHSIGGTAQIEREHEFALNFVYQPGRLPLVRQMWYALCDIQLPAAQELLRKNISLDYNPDSGYVPVSTLSDIRDMIKADVRATSNQLEASENESMDVSIDDEWR